MTQTKTPENNNAQILIAEDSPTQAEQLRGLLEEQGYRVVVTRNGQEALAEMAGLHPQLVISDIVMPIMDGFQLCREIKSNEKLKQTPVILLTSLSGTEEVLKALECGADNFIRKPYEGDYLLARVADVIKGWEQRKAGKMKLGVEIDLEGRKYFVTSERQQILDLLLSTFMEAVRINQALAAKQQELNRLNASLEQTVHDRTAALQQEAAAHKQAREALAASEMRYRHIIEKGRFGFFHSTADGRLLQVNPALVDMLGYSSQEELLGLRLDTDVYKDAGQRAALLERYKEAGYRGGAEVEWEKKDGTSILVHLIGRALQDEQGEIRGTEVIVEDVTERRMLEKQNRVLQKYEAIGQLAGGIAHDFNNVIGVILGWAELGLEEEPAESTARLRFEKIRDQGRRCTGLVRQLLAFARRQVLETRKLNLNEITEDVVGLLGKTIEANITVRTVLASDLQIIEADPTQIEQVLMNLCLNARDAMPQGGELVLETKNVVFDEGYCRLHSYAKPGYYVQLSVSDSGTGMDADTVEKIFEPFFTTKEVGKGTGLGLATVYGIVKQHKGFLHVYSEPGHGATFRVYLPVVEGLAERQKQEEDSSIRGGKETILVAEDHEGGREIAQEVLRKLGYTVLLAGDGEEALRLFEAQEEHIDLLLLDVIMPRLGGVELYARISERRNVPVIFATGYSKELGRLGALLKQGADILQKPYAPRTLAKKVREVLDRAGRAPRS